MRPLLAIPWPMSVELDRIESLFIDRLLRQDEQALIWVQLSMDLEQAEITRIAILEAWVKEHVSIDIVSQALTFGYLKFSVSLPAVHLSAAQASLCILEGTTLKDAGKAITHQCMTDLSAITLVGSGMRSHQGVASQMFSALSDASIAVHAISTSEIKICCIVEATQANQAMSVLEAAFGL